LYYFCILTDFPGDSKKEAVQIIRRDPETKDFVANQHLLQHVFCQDAVAEKKIAIYSIAGKFREGKSFMLNFFLRFLRAVREGKVIFVYRKFNGLGEA